MFSRITRRLFLKGSIFTALSAFFGGFLAWERDASTAFVRPPGAVDESEFLGRCIRCFLCGEVCPNKAVKFGGLKEGIVNLGTPYLQPRDQGCILCMKCNHICPTGALERIEDNLDDIIEKVDMGEAEVEKGLCYAYNNRLCGFCYGACPLPDVALSIDYWTRPTVTDKCVGCGLCEKICIQVPQAIRVRPRAKA